MVDEDDDDNSQQESPNSHRPRALQKRIRLDDDEDEDATPQPGYRHQELLRLARKDLVNAGLLSSARMTSEEPVRISTSKVGTGQRVPAMETCLKPKRWRHVCQCCRLKVNGVLVSRRKDNMNVSKICVFTCLANMH